MCSDRISSNIQNRTGSLNKKSVRIRRERRIKRRLARFLVILSILIPVAISFGAIRSYADPSASVTAENKYYKSIVVMPGDTLQEIAELNLSPEYSSSEEYMEEVRQMNHLDFDYNIHTGEYLLVPYYR